MIHPFPRNGGAFKRLSGPSRGHALQAGRAMGRYVGGLAIIATLALVYIGTQTDFRYQWQSRNTIAELRELPLGQVKVRGVVTYVDYANRRFWLQDETGAIAVK